MNTIIEFFRWLNPVLWPLGSLILAYLSIVLVCLVTFYSVLMNWKKYQAGRLIRQLYIALAVLTVLSTYRVFFGAADWLHPPEAVEWWRPTLQVVIYVFVAVVVTRIFKLMVTRWSKGSSFTVAVEPKPRESAQTGPNAVVRPGD